MASPKAPIINFATLVTLVVRNTIFLPNVCDNLRRRSCRQVIANVGQAFYSFPTTLSIFCIVPKCTACLLLIRQFDFVTSRIQSVIIFRTSGAMASLLVKYSAGSPVRHRWNTWFMPSISATV